MAGIPVDGISRTPRPPRGALSLPAKLTLATWTGSFQGHTFALTVTFNTAGFRNLASATIDIDGTYGSQKVRFVAGATSTNSQTATFHGTVGYHHVSGSVRPFTEHGATEKAVTTFKVTG